MKDWSDVLQRTRRRGLRLPVGARACESWNSEVLANQRSYLSHFSMKTFVFVQMKTNTLKTSPSTFHFRWSSLHDRQPLTCPLPFLFSHSVSPFSLFFPHLAQAGLLCLAAGCPPDCTAAALRSLCRHACFYEVPRQNPELRVLSRHSIIPKLNLTSRERLLFTLTHLSPTFL